MAIGSDSAREEIKRVINGGIIVCKANNKRSKKRRKNVRCFIKYIYIYIYIYIIGWDNRLRYRIKLAR